MRVSIVIPSYNQGRFLRATLESILTQEGEPAEVLVFDGGSTDDSVAILKEYGERISWVSKRDHGQSDAINKGLREASGEILAYLNSDDVYFPGALEAVRRHFASDSASKVVYGRAHHLKEDGRYLEDYPTERWNYGRLQETCFLCQPATFWRREVVEEFGVFDPDLQYAMDYEYWLRIGKHHAFAYLSDAPALAGSRLHGDTKTLSARVKVHRETLRVVQRHGGSCTAVQGWLRHLAHYRTIDECGEPANAGEQRVFVTRWATHTLLAAREFGVPLDELGLAEIGRHVTAANI